MDVGQNRRSIDFDREEEINIIFDNISFAIFNLIERWVLINTHSADWKRGLIGGARVFTRGYARTMQNRLGSLVHSRHSVFGAPRTYSFENGRACNFEGPPPGFPVGVTIRPQVNPRGCTPRHASTSFAACEFDNGIFLVSMCIPSCLT